MTIIVTTPSTSGTLPLIRGKIQARGYGNDTPEAQDVIINSIYRRIVGMRHWEWLEADNATIVTVASTNAYSTVAAIPDLLHIDAVRMHQGVERLGLDFIDYQILRDKEHWDQVTGTPFYWSQTANEIRLYPIPDGIYTLTVDYIKDPPDLVTDADQSLIPQVYEDILAWGSIAELAYRERDFDASSFAMNQYQGRLNEMVVDFGIRQRQGSTQVAAWDGWLA